MRRFLKLKALFLALLLTLSTLMVLPSVADIGKFSLPTWITENRPLRMASAPWWWAWYIAIRFSFGAVNS